MIPGGQGLEVVDARQLEVILLMMTMMGGSDVSDGFSDGDSGGLSYQIPS